MVNFYFTLQHVEIWYNVKKLDVDLSEFSWVEEVLINIVDGLIYGCLNLCHNTIHFCINK